MILVLLAGGAYLGYSHWLGPEFAARASVEKLLEEAEQTVDAGDAARILALLDRHLAPEARVTLDVSFGVLTGGAPASHLQYDKMGFLQFMEGVLNRTKDRASRLAIAEMKMKEGGTDILLSGKQEATAEGGMVPMRYIALVKCETVARITDAPVFSTVKCNAQLQGMPRAAGVNLQP